MKSLQGSEKILGDEESKVTTAQELSMSATSNPSGNLSASAIRLPEKRVQLLHPNERSLETANSDDLSNIGNPKESVTSSQSAITLMSPPADKSGNLLHPSSHPTTLSKLNPVVTSSRSSFGRRSLLSPQLSQLSMTSPNLTSTESGHMNTVKPVVDTASLDRHLEGYRQTLQKAER